MAHHRYPYLDAPTPLAFAHRGGAAVGDENTAEAFARAVAMGYRYVETDTHATADGVAVVFHDATLRRMLGRPEKVHQLRWADLASERINGASAVPRLAEALDAWPQVRFNIEFKSDQAVAPGLAAVRAAGALDRVLFASFSDARLARVRRQVGPSVPTSMATWEVTALWSAVHLRLTPPRPRPGVVAAQVPLTYGPLRVISPRFIAAAHRLGLQVHVWTVDDADQINRLLDLGVDGIMTDRIDVLRDVYRCRGLWAA